MTNPNSKIQDTPAFDLEQIKIDESSSGNVLGYYLTSTATIHVEEPHEEPNKELLDNEINKIAKHLIDTQNPQLTIYIHGYANTKNNSRDRSKIIYKYAAINNSYINRISRIQ
ncbi:MAG: hypothetical protein KME17_16250 [Cyanosarcina radialis HA8281-LM2]|jgi:hypothetical protein|nr:hypothetical protein [Cyanosarcina radialis HA8281-LM2]